MGSRTVFKSTPAELLAWLRYPFVITDKLKQTRKQVRMQILSHEQVDADPWEREVLRLPVGLLLRREIVMWGDEKPCWFARTIIPQVSYQAHQSFFDRLYQEPLANLIFDEPRVCRYRLHSYAIDANNPEYHWVTPRFQQKEPVLWMRLSFFELDQQFPFYLAEVFLPDLLR